ncbi:MAG: metalloregulator ArsR/SmtB family transcription factor [Sandaracinaceae bacterium]|nr:metalloregulator ArsR/SmtB family transcription factor [Sandaracinaceae bacterium]
MGALSDVNVFCGLLADPTRVRLLALLASEELSVAELCAVTGLAQSRVSTHLGKLRDAGLVAQRREGASTFHRVRTDMPARAKALWDAAMAGLDDSSLAADRERCAALVRAREGAWPDAVAGQMERHYSPGRTWEATARGFLGLARFGDVLDAGSGDGTLAALIAPRAKSVTCLDRSERVLTAAQARLAAHDNVRLVQGDLHELPFEDASFDTVMLFNVLTFARRPAGVLAEVARVLRPGGQLALVTLAAHEHPDVAAGYGHVVPGFSPAALAKLLERAGLSVDSCEITSRERRQPHFSVLTAYAERPR